jgi:hypothetical protein
MKINALLCVVIAFFIHCIPLYAGWDPEFLGLDTSTQEVLKRKDYNELRDRILNCLQNSWCSKDKADLLLSLVVLTSPKTCVEIGAFTGSTTLPILAGLQYCGCGKAYVIEAWDCQEAIRGLPISDLNTQWWGSLDMSSIRARFYEMVNKWSLEKYCRVLAFTSQKIANRIGSIDFLHLDGNFSEEGALLDSELYVPKVVSGGYIVLSNVHVMVAGKPSKMKALMKLLDHCEVVCEIDDGQTLLFRKN